MLVSAKVCLLGAVGQAGCKADGFCGDKIRLIR